MTFNKEVAILQFNSDKSYEKNLIRLVEAIKSNPKADILVAPEVLLTAFDYDNFDKVGEFYNKAIEQLTQIIDNQILVLTLVYKSDRGFVNRAVVINRGKVVYTQDKVKLFTIGDERKYFISGDIESIIKFEIDGITYGILICFELRFKEIWKRLEGCDVIIIPSRWGLPRKAHLETLSQALAIVNQCFVLLSNSSDSDMASSSAIINPNGEAIRDDNSDIIYGEINSNDIKKIRRYISMK